jgi:hypothetical protein
MKHHHEKSHQVTLQITRKSHHEITIHAPKFFPQKEICNSTHSKAHVGTKLTEAYGTKSGQGLEFRTPTEVSLPLEQGAFGGFKAWQRKVEPWLVSTMVQRKMWLSP